MHSLYHNRYRHEIDYRKKDAATKATSHIFFLSIIPLNYIWSPQLSQKYCTMTPNNNGAKIKVPTNNPNSKIIAIPVNI